MNHIPVFCKKINKLQNKNRSNLIRQGALLWIQCFWDLLLYCIDTTLNWTRKYKSAGMACIHYCSRPNRGKSFYTAHSTSFNFLFRKTANKWVSRTETERETEVTTLTNFSIASLNSSTFQHLWHWLTLPQWWWRKQSGRQRRDSPYLRTVTLVGYHCPAVHPITTKTFLGYLWDWFF